VTFPISVLASVTNQELTSYAWIFPNVVTNGHWWYSNTPAFIEHDLAARLEAVPRTKQIAYYSDMYKLEFALPKFAMFKRILAKVLAERFVIDRGWTEEQAVALGTQVLRGNVETIFRSGEDLREEMPSENAVEMPLPGQFGAIPIIAATEAASGVTPVFGEGLEQSAPLMSPLREAMVVPVPKSDDDEELKLASLAPPNKEPDLAEAPELEVIEDEAGLEPADDTKSDAPDRYEDQWGFLTRDDGKK
jgi:hypothetical protein